ncbi:helix-turn-helix domain-containing protein [Xanthomarina gelatinilytica]|uniref:helix-turn-helix domain-containing protein n=1 Tax=Xanthomarina gelatinilytica TaxID=1137281 RepID=UPI003AA9DB48
MSGDDKRLQYIDKITNLTAMQKYLLVMLGRYSPKKNGYSCWYGQGTLAEIMCTTKPTLRAAIKALEAERLIYVKRVRTGAERNKPNIYTLNMPEIIKKSEEVGKQLTHLEDEGGEIGDQCEQNTQQSDEVGKEFSHGGKVAYPHVGKQLSPNSNKNRKGIVITRGQTASQFRPDINARTLTLYKSIKLFVANRYSKLLPREPSCEDIEAIEWANEFFELESLGLEITTLCEFAIKELGDDMRIINPMVRLSHAYDALEAERGEMEANNRFRYGFECYE